MDLLDQKLLDGFQKDFPLVERPFAAIGERLGVSEGEVLSRLAKLQDSGTISRVGGVFRPGQVGASTLAAFAVLPEDLDEVAEKVSAHENVNHNYARDHHYNLWFVVTGDSEVDVTHALGEIEQSVGLPLLNLPMVEDYHLDLGFDLKWT